MERDYIAGQQLAKKMMEDDKEKAAHLRSTLQRARVAHRLEGITHENDHWLKEGFLDGTKDL